MTLEKYLRERGLARQTFATRLGVSRQAVDYWLRGCRFPRPEMIMKIERVTGGSVRAADWYRETGLGGSK